MAKGDPDRTQNLINSQGGLAQNHLNNLRNDTLIPQNQNIWNRYTTAADKGEADYGNIMGQYQDFAKTGGYGANDLANIRSRALSPTRAIYQNAQRNVDRQRTLQGGYSPGYGTLMSRFAREQGQGLSDASTNAEAQIAQMVNQGKQFGVQGSQSLYGTTPGMANMFGNQVLESTGQRLQGEGLQQNLGLGLIGSQMQKGNMKGGVDWGTVLKYIGTGASIAAMASDRNLKHNIESVKPEDIETNKIVKKFKKLPIYEWSYKGETERHIGPMAQDFKRIFKKGDGKSISIADIIGPSLAISKAMAEKL